LKSAGIDFYHITGDGASLFMMHRPLGIHVNQCSFFSASKNRIVQSEATGQIVAVKPVLGQNSGSHVATQPDLTGNIHFLGLVQFPHSFSQVIHRNVLEAFDEAHFKFFFGSNVQQGDAAVFWQCIHVVPVEILHLVRHHVFDGEASHINGILRRRVRRRIAKFQLRQIKGSHAGPDGGCKHVAAFVNTLITNNLGTKDLAGALLINRLDGHIHGSRVIPCVRCTVCKLFLVIKTQSFCCFFVDPRGGHSQVKGLQNGASLGFGINARNAADIIRCDSSLFIGRSGKWNHGLLSSDEIDDFHRIPHRINIRIGGEHVLIYDNAASFIAG